MSAGITDGNIKARWAVNATWSPASVAANTTAEQTLALPGLTLTDLIDNIIKPTAQAGLGIVGWRVSALDTIAITFANNTASPIVPTAAQVYTVIVARPDGVTLPTSLPR